MLEEWLWGHFSILESQLLYGTVLSFGGQQYFKISLDYSKCEQSSVVWK
jgi:hypothetical protein